MLAYFYYMWRSSQGQRGCIRNGWIKTTIIYWCFKALGLLEIQIRKWKLGSFDWQRTYSISRRLVSRFFKNESCYKLISFVFYDFAWHNRSFIETYSFTNPRCHMNFKVSKMHPFIRMYGIIRKEAYFLRENWNFIGGKTWQKQFNSFLF